jgi:hypothetical protein
MVMLAMTIMVHFWMVYWVMGHCATYTQPKAQPAALHCNLNPNLATSHLAHTVVLLQYIPYTPNFISP